MPQVTFPREVSVTVIVIVLANDGACFGVIVTLVFPAFNPVILPEADTLHIDGEETLYFISLEINGTLTK